MSKSGKEGLYNSHLNSPKVDNFIDVNELHFKEGIQWKKFEMFCFPYHKLSSGY